MMFHGPWANANIAQINESTCPLNEDFRDAKWRAFFSGFPQRAPVLHCINNEEFYWGWRKLQVLFLYQRHKKVRRNQSRQYQGSGSLCVVGTNPALLGWRQDPHSDLAIRIHRVPSYLHFSLIFQFEVPAMNPGGLFCKDGDNFKKETLKLRLGGEAWSDLLRH